MSFYRVMAVAVLLGIGAAAPGQSPWTLVSSGQAAITHEQEVNGEWNLVITGTGVQGVNATLRCTSGTQAVRYIRVVSQRSGTLESNVQLNVSENGGTISFIREISKDPQSNAEVWLGTVVISGALGSPTTPHSGFISADVVGILSAGGLLGTINADITAGPRLFGGTSTITQVTTTGNLNGNVTAEYGGIGEVSANGDIGSGANFVQIRTRDVLQRVFADTIWADIDTMRNSGIGDLWWLNTVVGDFHGSLLCHDIETPNLNPGLNIVGDLDADIVVTEDVKDPIVVGGELASGRTIWIGDSLQAPGGGGDTGEITLGADGLAGQVVINGNNGGGTWTGDVTVGATTLDGPYYADVPGDLGGGSVGLAPFNLHAEACTPPSGSQMPSSPTQYVILRHYGPVTWDDIADPNPVEVWYREVNTQTWFLLSEEDYFTVALTDPRELLVVATTEFDFDDDWDYMILPKEDVLRCVDVGAGDVDVVDYEYFLFGEP